MQSIAGSIMIAAQLGLEPGVNGQGYLIPYKTTCTFVPGWKGLCDLVARSGRATVWTGAVFEGDTFTYQLGDEPYCRHTPSDSADEEGQFTHVYAIGRVKDAQMPVIEVWSRAKIKKHLAQYNKVGTRHYALASENNMQMYGRKVALLQVLKYMPSSIELSTAATLAAAADTGEPMTIDMPASLPDPDTGEIDAPTLHSRIWGCTDPAVLGLLDDDVQTMEAGPAKDALQAAIIKRAAELAESA
jgi:recombination protein RecT